MLIRKETDIKTKETMDNIEQLSCGHQNNLLLANRVSGKCPKGCVVDKHGNRVAQP